MELLTKYFSTMQYTEDEVIYFKDGIFGFQDFKKYVLIRFENKNDSLICLQSIDEPNIAFVMINPYKFLEDYNVSLYDEDYKELEISDSDSILVYNICVVNDSVLESTANLKCPIVVNSQKRLAKQVILEDSSYPFKYPFSKLVNKEVRSC